MATETESTIVGQGQSQSQISDKARVRILEMYERLLLTEERKQSSLTTEFQGATAGSSSGR